LTLPHHDGNYWSDLDANWKVFFQSREQQDMLRPIIESLEKRSGMAAERYIRDEFVWVRSAFADTLSEGQMTLAPSRQIYDNPEKAPRRGRAIAFSVEWRQRVLKSLSDYERNLEAKGLMDPPGLALRAHRYATRLMNERPTPLNYRCVLVDEIQDLGTVELELVRALSKLATNQLFLTGDARQQVFPKEHNLRAAGIEVSYRRSFRKNYRNPRQILEAAVAMMQQFDDETGRADEESEPLEPQYSARESPQPLVIQAESPDQEREHIVRYIEETRKIHDNPICVVACSLREDDEAGMVKLLAEYKRAGLEMSALDWNSALRQRTVFLSALETVKGFEFSLVILSGCNSDVIPNPALPNEEHWRDARRLYVAMTRARDELILTHTGEPSRFLQGCGETLQRRSVREEGLVNEGGNGSDGLEAPPTPGIMTEIERLDAENEQLRAWLLRSKPYLRVSPKGAMSLYGLGRFPVTLYKEQWLRLLAAEDQIRLFIRENDHQLSIRKKNRRS
jgi:superfamily I DNA/RNA helicase